MTPSTSTRTLRPTWDDFFLRQLPTLATRATCDRGRSAAIFVRDNDQLAAGYVGSPPGMAHCDDVGHLWDDTGKHCLRTVHAEQNAMLRALRHGISLRDTTVYCTMVPCFTCAKLMVGVGVYRVVALHNYHDSENTRQLFLDADVALCTMSFSPLYDPHQQDNSNEECVVARTSVPDTVATVNRDMICPRHNVTFSTVEKSVNGVRICPHGETWILRYGVFINVDELESGEAINL